MVVSGTSVNLITLFLGGLRPPKQVHKLLESAEGGTKVCGRMGMEPGIPGS